jgi:hypothetical protein
MTTSDTDLLSELIARKHDCLTQLREMGSRQLELVRSGTIVELLDVLSAKQRALTRLQQIEKELDPFRDQDPDLRRWRTTQQRQQCAKQVEQCESLLREIMAKEKQSESELAVRRDDAATQLQGIHQSGKARGAYTAQSRSQTARLDLSCE